MEDLKKFWIQKDICSILGLFTQIDLFLGDLILPAKGLGIELGYAHDSNVPIVLMLKKVLKIQVQKTFLKTY